MTSSLSDFSVESDSVIVLTFFDGTHRRVKPADLHRYLKQEDLAKVRRALSVRKHFIKKVLPPGTLVILVGATVALALYDGYRLAQMINDGRRSTQTQIANPLIPKEQWEGSQLNFNATTMPEPVPSDLKTVPVSISSQAITETAPTGSASLTPKHKKDNTPKSVPRSPKSTSILQNAIDKLIK